MSLHPELGDDLPALIAGRLEGDALRRVQAHLATCTECSAFVEDLRPMVEGLDAGGGELFSEHPTSDALTAWASSGADAASAIGRHVELCASCALESAIARRTGATRPAPTALPRRYILPAAAAVLAAFSLGLLFGRVVSPRGWTGAIELPVFPPTTRGEPAETTIHVELGQPTVVLPAPLSLPDDIAPSDPLRIEVVDERGKARSIVVSDRAGLERRTEPSGALGIMLPARDLPPGRYTLRLRRDGSGGQALLEFPFVVAPAP
jgi:anti-sigma factor RsiW